MATDKYINLNGLTTFWDEVKKRIPKKTSQITNDSGYITRDDVATTALPGTMSVEDKQKLDSIDLDQLVEVDDAIDPTSENPVQNKVISEALDDKVDKVSGKGLSTNDYTTAEKNKLASIAAGAQVNVIEAVQKNGQALAITNKTVNITVPEALSDLTNDLNYVAVLSDTVSGWNGQPSLESEKDVLYIYTDYGTDSQGNDVPGIKIGDGKAYLIDLPFIDALAVEHRNNSDIHVTAQQKEFWNNKVRCYYSELYNERVVFTTD